MLNRPQFDLACRAFINKYATVDLAEPALKRWSWVEHASLPGYGYMSRTSIHLGSLGDTSCGAVDGHDLEDSEDIAALAQPTARVHRSCHYVVYSATFQVPTFYFTIHDSNGSPLQLEDIMKTSLLRHHSLLDAETTSFALSLPTAIFPLLSQGDHPTLGTPCWYLHPCQTDPAVNEIVEEVRQDDWTNEEYLVRWLEAWFMVIGTTVDFGA